MINQTPAHETVADLTSLRSSHTANIHYVPKDEEEIVNEQEQNEIVNEEEEGKTTNTNN